MADDAQSLQSLNWLELFPFTNLFRAFRVAIHPSKLMLGFGLLVFIYLGGRVLDIFWPATQYASYQEIDSYSQFRWSHDPTRSFDQERGNVRERNASLYARQLLVFGLSTQDKAATSAYRGEMRGALVERYVSDRNAALESAAKIRDEDLSRTADQTVPEDDRERIRRDTTSHFESTVKQANAECDTRIRALNAISPRPLFDIFFEYESRQFHNLVESTLSWNWMNGTLAATGDQSPAVAGRHQIDVGSVNVGVIKSMANLTVIGPGWLLRYHPVYFVLFTSWFLVIWAIFGGAIARIAAVHVARDEKISSRQALRFSSAKLLSFVFAPVIPLIIMSVAGLIVAAGGLLMYAPVIGPIALGALFILALVAGFIVTLVAVGMAGGFNLMYPTIAIEGSDSFDAISRSFSYVFARPWRMIFYSVLSLIYGALCFIFVRYFVYVMLSVTRYFTQMFLFGQPGRYFPEIWPAISDQDMTYLINRHSLAWSEQIAAFLIAMWVYVVLSFLASFVISFYFSANTIIYFLMRREVDATELDDVFIEESEDDFHDAEPAPATPARAESVPAAPAPGAAG